MFIHVCPVDAMEAIMDVFPKILKNVEKNLVDYYPVVQRKFSAHVAVFCKMPRSIFILTVL